MRKLILTVAFLGCVRAGTGPAAADAGASAPLAGSINLVCGIEGANDAGVIHAIGAFDSQREVIVDVRLPCRALVGDATGNALGGVQVNLLAEAGGFLKSGVLSDDAGVARVD